LAEQQLVPKRLLQFHFAQVHPTGFVDFEKMVSTDLLQKSLCVCVCVPEVQICR
jgi:hypothetical protein